jgi:hypothetical protein
MEEKKLHKKISVVTLPFNLVKKNTSNNPFDFSSNFEEHDAEDLVDIKMCLGLIGSRVNLPIDSPKHHRFVSNHIGSLQYNNSSFLKVISVLPEYYNKLEELNFNTDVSNVYINNTEWKVNFTNGSYIILNEFAGIGYFVFSLEMEILTSNILNQLSGNDFFRYYCSETEKYKLSIKQLNDANIITLNFKQLIEKYFTGILPFIKFQYEKPIVLHLFGKDSFLDLTDDNLNNTMYKILRIPPAEISQDLNVFDFLETTNNKFLVGASHEGAVVIDEFLECNGLFKKYFPSFIFSLNQREIMIQLNKSISCFNSNQLDSDDDSVFEKLEKLKKKVSIYQLKQVFYSISFYDEINFFYSKLIKTFNIELLIKDNNECISEIHELISLKREKSKEETEKLNSSRLNLILLLLTIAQVWPYLLAIFLEGKDFQFTFIASEKVNIGFYSLIILIGLTYYFIILRPKSKNKLNWKDKIKKLKSFIPFANKKENKK